MPTNYLRFNCVRDATSTTTTSITGHSAKVCYLQKESRAKFTISSFHFRLKSNKKDDQYKLLWAELIHLLQIGPQSAQHKKISAIIKNENISDANKDTKRLSSQMTNSPMSPPGSSEIISSKKKIQQIMSSGNR